MHHGPGTAQTMNSYLSHSSPCASNTPTTQDFFQFLTVSFLCGCFRAIPHSSPFVWNSPLHSTTLPTSASELPVQGDLPSAVLFHGTLVPSFTENTTILNYFITCLLVCFLSSPLDPQIRPHQFIYHCKPVPSTMPDRIDTH